ncbi:GNAT family N-acetyltransferase [Streptomyces sp. 6N223]|uniref:GNAT family N-acetyltransferase n=1 Tax=Streptomyces sp. 6N223 TaxID=3457412 RepID=UPI003FD4616C
MGRQLVPLTLDNLSDLPSRCRDCVFWELDPVSGESAVRSGQSVLEKEAWISVVLLEWGTCGRVVYVDRRPVGYVLYAPPAYVPRSRAFPTSPVSADAVQLMTGWVSPGCRSRGLGRTLVQAVAKDVLGRGFRAIEAFGAEGGTDQLGGEQRGCVLPTGYLLAAGFEVVRPHPAFPRLRLELKSTVSWRADVELALDRLLGGTRPITALRPF